MIPLPNLMVAPNGARLGVSDHPALPVTLAKIVATATACRAAGADGLHLHLRDNTGAHILDGGLYREAVTELGRALPGFAVQATTEAVGQYSPAFQRQLALDCGTSLVSVAMREIAADGEISACKALHDASKERGISLQYILYNPDDLTRLAQMLGPREVLDGSLQVLFVLGNHQGVAGRPEMLEPFLDGMTLLQIRPDWMVCAFGVSETASLLAAHAKGGKMRVGFENSLWHQDGSVAADNAARIARIRTALAKDKRA